MWRDTTLPCIGASTMTFMIIFILGYLVGGVTALFILGLTVAARRGDRGDTTSARRMPAEETVAAWHRKG
jgi:hypothetical protein